MNPRSPNAFNARPLTARLIALLERAGPLTLAEIANRLNMVDDKETLVTVLHELGPRVVEAAVYRGGSLRVRVWSVEGDSRLRALGPLPRIEYRGPATLEALRAAALRFLTGARRQRGR